MSLLRTCLVLCVFAACDGGGSSSIDPAIPCRTGNCGKESFRRAVPSRTSVLIDSPRSTARRIVPLDAVSEDFTEVVEYVDEIDGIIDDVFGDLEYVVGDTPEVADDSLHRWRVVLEGGDEGVLELAPTEDDAFVLEYHEGDPGFDPSGPPILAGTISTSDDGIATFTLKLDLDAESEASGEDASGTVTIAGHPFESGDREIWFDLDQVSIDGEPAETSRTTYWRFDDGSDALEYVADIDGASATVFARWDDDGSGRYDHHVTYVDDVLGPVDEIATNCWQNAGAEVFDAFAMIDDDGELYGELDGDEDSCVYGPLDGHPDPGAEFDDLPGEGEWDELELLTPPA